MRLTKNELKIGLRVRGMSSGRLGTITKLEDGDIVKISWDNGDQFYDRFEMTRVEAYIPDDLS